LRWSIRVEDSNRPVSDDADSADEAQRRSWCLPFCRRIAVYFRELHSWDLLRSRELISILWEQWKHPWLGGRNYVLLAQTTAGPFPSAHQPRLPLLMLLPLRCIARGEREGSTCGLECNPSAMCPNSDRTRRPCFSGSSALKACELMQELRLAVALRICKANHLYHPSKLQTSRIRSSPSSLI
jgi:hypothetical protein